MYCDSLAQNCTAAFDNKSYTWIGGHLMGTSEHWEWRYTRIRTHVCACKLHTNRGLNSGFCRSVLNDRPLYKPTHFIRYALCLLSRRVPLGAQALHWEMQCLVSPPPQASSGNRTHTHFGAWWWLPTHLLMWQVTKYFKYKQSSNVIIQFCCECTRITNC